MKKANRVFIQPSMDMTLIHGSKTKLFSAVDDDYIDEFLETTMLEEGDVIIADKPFYPMETMVYLMSEDIFLGINIGAIGCGNSEYLINLTSDALSYVVDGNLGIARFEFKPMLEEDLLKLPNILDVLDIGSLAREEIFLLVNDDYAVKSPVLLNSDRVRCIKISSLFNN